MKIALFHNLPAGGAKRALYEHARALHARGHVLDAYVMDTAAGEFLPLTPFCRRVIRPRTFDVSGSRSPAAAPGLLARTLGGKIGSLRGIWQDLRQLAELEKTYARVAAQIDAEGYDVAYVHHCRFLLSPSLLRFLRTPSVYFSQDTLRQAQEWALETDPAYDARRLPPLRRRVRGRIMAAPQARLMEYRDEQNARNLRAATLTLANSWYSREAILRAYGVSARVCYLGVDSAFFTPPGDGVREHSVLSVGNLGYNKRHDFVIDAVAAIPKERRPLLRIIGYEVTEADAAFGETAQTLGPLARGLLAQAEALGVEVRLEKEVTDETLRRAYQRCGVVAFAPHLEPFGFVSLEAMACAAPVVGVAEGGLRETIEGNVTGYLTDRDPVEFGGALDKVLSDGTLAGRFGSAGRQAAVSQWTWDRSTDTLERLFGMVVQRPAEERREEASEALCASP